MGLDYLNKKCWHTGSIKNIEKVWIREQKEAEKLKREKEREKKLQEERHQEQIKELQKKAGYISENNLARMDWMISNQSKQMQQQTAEEFLMGKEVDEKHEPQLQAIKKEEFTNQKCEDFVLKNEDPLYKIMQEEQKQKMELKNNPIQMQKLIKLQEERELKKKLKKLKKKQKKEKKEKKSKKKSSKREQNSHSRSRSRSESAENKSSKKKSKKSKKSKKNKRSSSSDSDSSSSNSDTLSQKSSSSNISGLSTASFKSSASQQYYENFMKQRLGQIVTKDESGNLQMDFGRMKKMFKPQKENRSLDSRPLTDEEKTELRKKMNEDAKKLTKDKLESLQKDYKDAHKDDDYLKEEKKHDFKRKMQHQLYNESGKNETLEDRIGRNRTRFQRNIDDDENTRI
ncbi:hypothetical protein PPERSA_11975 [Pseudocohnilembus persalinus]|uniref:CBF1-interacting co-repressor CIR N-terminal domain-containing protein n=1 Tax=Pseudocohnilembus persalinus TaxID=266149 RepID=A0A0V0QK92_PSEPJ|nr:hypothetical protein PPERSA_11975 [Pseudocohnilembus persalinus]|eukprot:KRX02635.1 hypothetical protein PPERSA_11975 [Pseudocohnilembus persalinus]